MKRLVIAVSFLMILGFATANGSHAEGEAHLDVGPGMVGADSAVYGLETAWDNAAMSIGLKQAGTVAQERAAEARQAAQANNSEAAQRAADELNSVAQRASSDDMEGLEKAAAVLQEVMERAPPQAQQGLRTALDSVRQEGDRVGANIPPEVNVTARMNEARELQEQARNRLDEGNTAMDAGDYATARDRFEEAENLFGQAAAELEDVDGQNAQTLRSQLQNAESGANNLELSVEAYMNGDNQTAQQYADDAEDDFAQSGGGQ